jgi:hypothetical protein
MTGLASLIASPIIATIGKILDKVIPDKDARAKAQEELAAVAGSQEFQLLLGQIEVNKIEAASEGWFKGGWRPATGWVCVLALGYTYVLYPFLQFIVVLVMDNPPVLPEVGVADLMPILLGMLGLGALRTYERVQGSIK